MDIFYAFATDASLETQGTWFNLSKDTKLKVARAGNTEYVNLLRKKLEDSRIDLDSKDDESNARAEKMMIEVMAETILLGWDGVKYQGADLEYNKANAIKLLQHKDFRRKVTGFSESFEAFRVKQEQELGNA